MIRILLILIPTLLISCGKKSPSKQRSDTKALEKVFTVLETDQVTAFRYQDWCKVISYSRGSFADNTSGNCTSIASGKPLAFDSTAKADLERIWKKVNAAGAGVDIISNVRFYSHGKLSYGEFDCSDGFTRQRYIYDPNYTLPKDAPGNRWHTKIDNNWYYILEDWN